MALKDTHELKNLRTKQRSVEIQIGEVISEGKVLGSKKKALQKDLSDIKSKIGKLSQKDIVVSEHAFLRYFERVKGFDLAEIQKEILNEGIISKHKALGNGTFPSGDHKIVIRNNTVITIKE